MGPPLKAAENERAGFDVRSIPFSSMGPPLKAAENIVLASKRCDQMQIFNGAAAKSSGK